jgi:exopolyphosphatase/guanosine-5'-triphosphate,3'-diphosphate pyrophosphatase
MTSTRVGAIDCGTNSIRLLIADVDSERGLVDVDRRMEIVRLGQDVDRTGELGAAALERTFVACETYADVLRVNDVRRLRFVATSASRDARNRDIFVAGVRDRLGVEPEVISGTEEAALAFAGATWELAAGVDSRLVVDIGGGSTEFVLGTDRPTASCSVDIGCVRITERHLHSDPPTAAEIAAATNDIDAALDVAGAQADHQFLRLIGLRRCDPAIEVRCQRHESGGGETVDQVDDVRDESPPLLDHNDAGPTALGNG